MRRLSSLVLLAASALSCPADSVQERAAADGAKLCPQRGLGGDDAAKLTPNATKWVEVEIGAERCEKMKGYLSVPDPLPAGRKCALFFMFHGNGDVGKHRVKNHAQITTERDPVIVIGVQYQALQEDGSGKMGLPTLADGADVIRGSRWLLDKAMSDYPVDPERVFVGGFSWGTAWASGWCAGEWKNDPEKFPFRACFLYGSGGAGSKATMPPIPVIAMCGEEETAVLGTINIVEAVRHYANVVASWGIPVQYHEIPKMGHAVNARCLQITRDIVNDLGGPGAPEYPDPGAMKSDPLPFAAPTDPYVKELLALCEADLWKAARDRMREIETDRKIALKDKKLPLAFAKEMQKFAETEMPRLEKILAQCARDQGAPNPFQVRRMKGLIEAWDAFPWAKKPSYAASVAPFTDDYPPVAREREREKRMRDAWALEAEEGKRPDAKALYEALAARKDEDGGKSPWPRAAAWRLKWWIDGGKK
jgi:acetyl esterase/lipase